MGNEKELNQTGLNNHCKNTRTHNFHCFPTIKPRFGEAINICLHELIERDPNQAMD